MKIENLETSTIIELPATHNPKPSINSWLFGQPLATADAGHQTIGKLVGLAVFSSDALSSVAYGPQEIFLVLAAVGTTSLHLAVPISVAIVALLAILTFSYEQTIHAYPGGGGAYTVSRDNLGIIPAQVAGAALLTDYILTVSVSISSGVAQVVSAFPDVYPYRVGLAVALILFVMLINLRGVKESGTTFAIPTYFFLFMIYLTVVVGFIRFITGSLGSVPNPPEMSIVAAQPLTLFLILRAFSNGTSSLTGVEAISNGIMAFKEPRSRNAGATLLWMAAILGSLMLCIPFLATRIHAIPAESETIISQLARTIYNGRGILYLATVSSTTVLLVMAANTAFADFPRLGALQAADGFLPRQLSSRGSRLVFTRGIVALALISSVMVIIFSASVTNLIPLYAIGVFLSFTMSQAGMARRWWKSGRMEPGVTVQEKGSVLKHDDGWRHKMVINGLGAVCTFVVIFVFAVTKFKDGAWIIVFLIPLLVLGFLSINQHYKGMARQLSLDDHKSPAYVKRNRIFMPIGGVHKGTLAALRYARTLSPDITAVHVSVDPLETERIVAKWEHWGDGVRLVVLESPYRLIFEPFIEYIDRLSSTSTPGEIITIVVPQFVAKNWWANFLHMRTAESLRKALLNRHNIIINEVPYQVG